MKKFRRILAILFIVAILFTLLTACTKTGTCELCHRENQKLKKLTVKGESAWLCPDCYKLMDALTD